MNIWVEQIEEMQTEINVENSKVVAINIKEGNDIKIKCKHSKLEIVK